MKKIRCLINTFLCLIFGNIKCGTQTGLRAWKAFYSEKGSSINTGNISCRDNCHIEAKCGGRICIGNHVNFNYNCIVVAHEKISIGDNVLIGPNVMIYDHDHDYHDKMWRTKFISKPVTIGNNVWIGGNVTILKGTYIGDNCVIGAGCVLAGKNISDGTIIVNKSNLNFRETSRQLVN